MAENEVLERLKAAFPDGTIYDEEYLKKLGIPLTREITGFSGPRGRTVCSGWLPAALPGRRRATSSRI